MSAEKVPIYHMCCVSDYELAIEQGGIYYSPTYHQDGIIHATENPALLLQAGTHFYRSSVGNWICLKIDANKLNAEVRYESPAAVGNIKAVDYSENQTETPRFPHIYGPINVDAVIEQFPIVRDSDGSFLSIPGLC